MMQDKDDEIDFWRVWLRGSQRFIGNVRAASEADAVREAIMQYDVPQDLQGTLIAKRLL
jgi:hypothetical protein